MNQKNQITSDSIAQFVNRLVEEKDILNLDPEILDQVKKDLYVRVERMINAAVIENLPPEKLEFFEKLVERSDQAEIQAFAQRSIPGLDEIIAKELVQFRNTYLDVQ